MSGSARVSVRLKASDWNELINFVNGDLPNMASDEPVRQHIERILDAIRVAIVKAHCDAVL